MSNSLHSPVTRLLSAVKRGDGRAREQLWSVIYDELHAVAEHQLADEARRHRRRPTSLVHEAYLRLTAGEIMQCTGRREFFSIAARAMRQIRIDDARKRKRLKRGGDREPAALDDGAAVWEQDPAELLAVDEALATLEACDGRQAEVVMLRYYGGLTVEECADALDISPRTVESDWQYARAWLHRALTDSESSPG